jgi:hypothetical protein
MNFMDTQPVQNNTLVPSAPLDVATVNPSAQLGLSESEAILKTRRITVIKLLFPNQGNDSQVRHGPI